MAIVVITEAMTSAREGFKFGNAQFSKPLTLRNCYGPGKILVYLNGIDREID